MGISLQFRTVEAVSPDVAEAIRVQLEEADPERPWLLCDPPHLDTPEGDGILEGWSKLNLHPNPADQVAWDPAEVEPHDLRALLDALCRVSGQYAVAWRLTIDGDPIGAISDGVCDDQLVDKMDALADLARELGAFDPFDPTDEGPDDSDGPSLRIWGGPDDE